MNGAKKKSIVILGVALICLVLLASCVVVAEHAHICIGENCNACSVIEAMQKFLASLLLTVASILLALTLFNVSYIHSTLKKFSFFTLISLKVKLSR